MITILPLLEKGSVIYSVSMTEYQQQLTTAVVVTENHRFPLSVLDAVH
jgi:hypothetical protein